MNVIEKLSPLGGNRNKPNRLIIHAMGQNIRIGPKDAEWYQKNTDKDIKEGSYHADEWLLADGTSAHYLIEPNGDILKLRKTSQTAWHAYRHNTDTIGVEVLLEGEWNYYTFKKEIVKDWVKGAQYESLIELSQGIIDYWKIPLSNVLRHSDIDPDRKVDPGSGFEWDYFKSRLKEPKK